LGEAPAAAAEGGSNFGEVRGELMDFGTEDGNFGEEDLLLLEESLPVLGGVSSPPPPEDSFLGI